MSGESSRTVVETPQRPLSARPRHAAAKRALDLLIGGFCAALTAPLVALLALAIRLESPGQPIYRQRRAGRDGSEFSIYKLRTMVRGAEFTGAGLAIQEGDDRITRVGAILRRYSLDELPNLYNVLRGEMSIVGPRPTLPVQVQQYSERQRGRLAVKPGITGWAQINGRASLPWPERIELDLWYVEHQSMALDLKIIARTSAPGARRPWPLQRRDGRMAGDALEDSAPGDACAVLLTGVGKRYDIVSAFAQHATVVAADPNPLAPAQYAAHHRRAVPRIDDEAYVPALSELCRRFSVGAVVPLTDLDLEVLAEARHAGRLPALLPDPEIARATYDKYETHLLLERLGLPTPPTVLPGQRPESYPVLVKPRRGSGARSIHRADDRDAAEFFVRYVREPTMVQHLMDGPEFSIDTLSDSDGRCLNAIPRTMLESRGGESIKGTVIDDAELIALGRRVVEALGVRGPCTVQAFRDREIGLGITDVNTRFGGAFPAPMYAALPGRTYPELIVRMARGERVEPHVGQFRAGITFSRYYWQLELDERMQPTGRDIIEPPGPPRPR